MASADERRFEVLRAIVADFVATKEPIGSKSLVERHNLGVSSATVRNDMAVLEAWVTRLAVRRRCCWSRWWSTPKSAW